MIVEPVGQPNNIPSMKTFPVGVGGMASVIGQFSSTHNAIEINNWCKTYQLVREIDQLFISIHTWEAVRLCICMDESWCIEKLLKLGIATIKRTMPLAIWHGVNLNHCTFFIGISECEPVKYILARKETLGILCPSMGIITPWLLVKLFNYFLIKTKANFWSLKSFVNQNAICLVVCQEMEGYLFFQSIFLRPSKTFCVM